MSDPKGHHDSPLAALWVSMTGASADDHHEIPPGIDHKSQAVGHEPDKFDVRGIVYVPIAVVIALVITYTVVQVGIGFLTRPATDNVAERKTINERLGRFSYVDPQGMPDEKTPSNSKPPVAQPRLEYLRQVDDDRPGSKDDPEYMRSMRPTTKGNSPEIYPESLRPENYQDPVTFKKPLIEYEWVKGQEVAQIPLADAVKILTSSKKLPTKKEATPAGTTQDKAKLSNGGVGGPALPKAAPKKDDHHDH